MSILSISNCIHTNFNSSTYTRNTSPEKNLESNYSYTCNTDNFQQEKQDYKKNLEELKKQGNYFPEENHWYGTKKAQYKYIATGRETLHDIKEKFNLKDGALKRCLPHLRDDDHTPNKGYEIFFYEEDVKTE